jgi:hypothetical protein
MPDLATLKTIGFTHVPFWYKQNQEREKRSLDSWRATQLMSANQTRAPNSPFAMPPRPIQASKATVPRPHTKAPSKVINRNSSTPANLLDLEDHVTNTATPSQKPTAGDVNLNKTRPLPPAHSRPPKSNAGTPKREVKTGRPKAKDKPQVKLPLEPLVPVSSDTPDLLTTRDSRDTRL